MPEERESESSLIGDRLAGNHPAVVLPEEREPEEREPEAPFVEGAVAPGGRRITSATVVLEMMYALLAVAALVMFGLREAGKLSEELTQLAIYFDHFICILFISQAMWNLWQAPSKLQWAKWGWADVLASIPLVEELRFLRWLRLFLVVRAMRSTIRSVQGIVVLFDVGRAKAVMAIVFALIVVSVITSSFLILGMEGSLDGENTIDSAEDALLWSLATLFGAEPDGFRGLHPQTLGGQIVNLWLVIVSLGLIGSLAGLISAWIEEEPDIEKLKTRQ